MDNQTIGHRQDSMGTIFPAVIMIKGNPFGVLSYHVLNHPFVDASVTYHSYHIAEQKAQLTPRNF